MTAAGLTVEALDTVGLTAEALTVEALTLEALTVEASAGVFEVLLGITLLFFEDLSVEFVIDGFGFAILADEVLAAGLLAAVLPINDV